VTEKSILEKTVALGKIQEEADSVNLQKEKQLKKDILDMLEQEELKWRQRAKEDWLHDGDRNTKFFHASASQKQRRNRIERITDRLGRNCDSQATVEQAFVHYFQDIFTTSNPHDIDACTEAIEGRLLSNLKDRLTATYTEDKVYSALMQMAPLKAPEPDGFAADFYQQNWSTVGAEVCKVALHFLNGSKMEENLNATHIALIPKKTAPSCVSKFRPISLCNVSYKIIAKVLANWLKIVLPHVISDNQSAFIPGQLITNNIVAAYETLHSMQSRMWSKVGFMGIKLDMSKVYDRVEWSFLEAVMRKMEFPEEWIKLIMSCVGSVSYTILVNGQPSGNIKPTRGIRQWDPLSPYLFLLCAEALSALLTRVVKKRVLTGVPTSRKGPRLSHLFFADDSLIFCKANSVEWRRLTKLLDKYEAASGQKLNKDKTSIFFSRNTSQEKREEISQLSGLQATQSYDKYLRLPTLVGKSRMQAFRGIKDRVWNCLNNWKTKFLTQAGKEILIKAVAQAIPTYYMSVFLLPKILCKEIEGMMQRFWWGHKDNTSRIHWMSWERMGISKAKGGLGFRDLEVFNKALLSKQLWRLLQSPNSLVAKILKAKYFPSSSILDSTLGNRPSYVWRNFMVAQSILKNGLIWRIGCGQNINVWSDKWVPK
jgi:hypothetical protein